MKSYVVMAALTLTMLTLVTVASASVGADTGPKIRICHVPPGNPEGLALLTLSPEVAQHHLDNHEGDLLAFSTLDCVYDPI